MEIVAAPDEENLVIAVEIAPIFSLTIPEKNKYANIAYLFFHNFFTIKLNENQDLN